MITVDWGNKIIEIPKDYLTPLGGSLYELPINQFRLDLKDLEDDEEGIAYSTTHNHNTTVTLSGITLARVVEIINNYTITFENGQYAVNLTGANSNIPDVTNVNQVSVRSFNSAGMVIGNATVTQADMAQIATTIWDESETTHSTAGTFGKSVQDLKETTKQTKNLVIAGL